MKKMFSFLLAICMLIAMAGCSGTNPSGGAAGGDQNTKGKIGIITGTIAQNEEEYQTAQKLKETYGDRVITATYPDNFSEKTEQTIAAVTNMAADPDVKVIVFVQAVPGAVEAIETVRETRDDILFICGVCGEDPEEIGTAADICIQADALSMGTSVVDQAVKQGAKTFVHISVERYAGYKLAADCQDQMKTRCEELNVTYVEVNAPDPAGEEGVIGTHVWIGENIKNYVDQYGKDTAFYAANCAMQAPLIQQAAELGAICPLQCCPSPYHGYPTALNISMEGHEGDTAYLLAQISEKVKEYGNAGRMSTWAVPINSTIIEAGFQYGLKWVEGEITQRCDEAALTEELQNLAEGELQITKYQDDEKGTMDNFFLISCPFYDF